MRTQVAPAIVAKPEAPGKSPVAYWLMVVFSFLYYFRPSDIIPGLGHLHMARITAILVVLALLTGTRKVKLNKLPAEVKIIFAMFVWMVLTIPFAFWKAGSFVMVFFEFSKAVMVAYTLTLTVTRMSEVRRLILMQALGVALMTVAAVIVNNRMQGRLAGVGDALLSNPNDLAMNVSLNWPLCLVFLLMSRKPLVKIFWGFSMLVMIYAVMQTYSRAGFMALAIAMVVCLWDFGIRGRRGYLIAIALVCGVLAVAVAPGNYLKRLETLVGRYQEGDLDRGSAQARRELLILSLKVTAHHPVFGIGPGNFPSYTGLWHVTHNTYTQFSSECGVVVMILFLMLLWRAFKNLRFLRKIPRARENEEWNFYASALFASFAAYVIGAFFSSSAYELFPYYMVMYTSMLYRLASVPREGEVTTVKTPIRLRARVYSPAGRA
ncbi:MAG TPA: O-antigen ligase family protein [Candidatus Binatia bacterium]|nr:O-antigen ligase family protein [Candidatus Binatia bacterium]